MMSTKAAAPVTVAIVGAGQRGSVYSSFALDFPERMKVVGVAEPLDFQRNSLAKLHGIAKENCFTSWTQLVEKEKFADAVFITTQDQMHKDPAVALADKGYNILLEKPMAVTYDDCEAIYKACERNEIIFAVCHVLRYLPVYSRVKNLLSSGAIGEVHHISHTENVGSWHFAHSFVRGNWRNTTTSSFSLLAKSCHDIDLISHWMAPNKCLSVSSFGALAHFTSQDKPPNAADRCLDCAIEEKCPYSAKKIYLRDRVEKGRTGWPAAVLCDVVDIENVTDALRTGPYGRCVYACDNDVISNQVVNFKFEGSATASFNMLAFTDKSKRETNIYGSHGYIEVLLKSTPHTILLKKFIDSEPEVITINETAPIKRMPFIHSGADFYLIDSFINAVQKGDQSLVATSALDVLRSHELVFLAEKSRLENRVIDIPNRS